MKKLLILTSLILLSACQKNTSGDGAVIPAQRAEGVIMRETAAGESTWQLKATAADFYDNQDVLMDNPKITFNQEKGDAVLTANKGSFKDGIITFIGSVMITSKEEDLKLTTSKLYYNTQTKVAWTDVSFVLKRSGITVKGKALKADKGFSNIEIFKQVTDLPTDLKGLQALK
ncbi:MAG: LPS export ABC transporter periplasmic protein LptC [Elusimicrobiaceae bacterium]|nr:LPS export ABC transporter periplasmic protein LptC [Elusimicrobiaceae bacterium]